MDPNIKEVLYLYKKGMKKQSIKMYPCLCPNCNKQAILSHSLQKKNVLESISDKNKKVIGIDKGTNSCKSYFSKSIKFTKYGIGEASVFKGFCNKHDTLLFEEIENGNFKPYLLRHNILLLFREVAFQFSDKRDNDEVMKYIKTSLSVFNKYKLRLFSYEIDKHEQDFMKNMIGKIYKDITNNTLEEYDFFSYVLNKKYELACLTIVDLKYFYPILFNKKDSFFCFSLFNFHNCTILSFSFLKKYRPYLHRLLKGDIEVFINKLIFACSERTFFNPEYWNKLDKTFKDYCEKSFVYPLVRDRNFFDPPLILDKFCSNIIIGENETLPDEMQKFIKEL